MLKFKMLYITLIIISITSAVFAENDSNTNKSGSVERDGMIKNDLPGQISFFFTFPEVEEIDHNKIAKGDENYEVIRAKRSSVEWIQKIVAKQWLPEDVNYLSENLLMVQNAFGAIDVTHIYWEKNGYLMESDQTMTTFTLKITPLNIPIDVNNIPDSKQKVRNVCFQIINTEVGINIDDPPNGPKIIKRDMSSKMINASFEKATVHRFRDGIHSLCSPPDPNDTSDKRNFNYWWRLVNWWTDGKKIGIYTLKTEGGAWEANYSQMPGCIEDGCIDDKWFDKDKPKEIYPKERFPTPPELLPKSPPPPHRKS